MVALAVMAVGIVGALELFAGSARLAGAATKQTEAVVLARSLVDGVLWRTDVDDETTTGQTGDYHWEVSVRAIDPQFGVTEEEPLKKRRNDYELKEIVVTVDWKGLWGPKSTRLETARVAEVY